MSVWTMAEPALRMAGEMYSGAQVLDPSQEIRHIVPYPYSSNVELVGREPVPRLSILSQASIDAAALAWKANPEAKVVLLGETCYDNTWLPNTTELMVARGRGQGIDEDAFVPLSRLRDGRPLNNTYLQTQGLNEHFESLPAGEDEATLVMALAYHLRRVARPVHAYPLLKAARFATTESVLHEVGVTVYDKPLAVTQELHEGDLPIEFLNAMTGRRGKFLNFLAKKMGVAARVVDAVPSEAGEFELEDDQAMEKLQRLMTQARTGFQAESA